MLAIGTPRGIREISKSGERCHEKQKAATR
jgi:hypothetical protein